MSKRVEIDFEDLRHLFDLAVDTPLVCSGSFDTEEVELLRRIAVTIDVDPNSEDVVPEEFRSQYPHAFVPRRVRPEPLRVWPNGAPMMRYETREEQSARMKEERADHTCQVLRCGKLAADPIHTERA